MFGKYYQDELAFLREMGKEFAAAYPQLGPMLADRGGDPDVERLLEGVAFLTGRIRQKLDDELPEAIHAIAELLFPHLIRPLPSATIIELTPLRNVLRENHVVATATEFDSIPVDGKACRFRSIWPCDLTPWAIEDIRMEPIPGGKQQLRIELRVPVGMPLKQIAPKKMRLHLAGEARTALALMMFLLEHTEDVVLVESKAGGYGEREVSLGKRSVTPVGFLESEALLPYPRATFPGYRLLEEYYVLPTKFAFVDVEGIAKAAEFGEDCAKIALCFRFDAPLSPDIRIAKDVVKLHCVPAINIFTTTSEPIRLSTTREQFAVRPAGLNPAQGEVYCIQKAEAIARGASQRFEINNFYDFSHVGAQSATQRFFYTTHIEPSVVGDGADVYISFGTPEDAGVLPDADVISLDLLATNRQLASALRAGEITVATPTSPAFATFKNLSAVTPHVPPPLGRELQWRVIAHVSMGLRSLTEPEVLRATLDVYNLHALVDRQAARANELRLAALKDVRVAATEQIFKGSSIRGVAIEVDLEEKGFGGDGDLYLFSMIMDHFFANYVSMNSFSRTTIHGISTKVKYAWPPRSGNQTLL